MEPDWSTHAAGRFDGIQGSHQAGPESRDSPGRALSSQQPTCAALVHFLGRQPGAQLLSAPETARLLLTSPYAAKLPPLLLETAQICQRTIEVLSTASPHTLAAHPVYCWRDCQIAVERNRLNEHQDGPPPTSDCLDRSRWSQSIICQRVSKHLVFTAVADVLLRQCESVIYCSERHHRQHWPTHKLNCKPLGWWDFGGTFPESKKVGSHLIKLKGPPVVG